MQLEIFTLEEQNTWTTVPRTKQINVFKGTWVFKLKQLLDDIPSPFKARFCASGELQQEDVVISVIRDVKDDEVVRR